MRNFRFLLILCIASIFASCNNSSTVNSNQSANSSNDTILKVYVDQTGKISANGKPTTIAELDVKMNDLKNKNGVVWYSRDNKTQDPPAESMQVMELITKYELPVSFYSDDSFTEVIHIN